MRWVEKTARDLAGRVLAEKLDVAVAVDVAGGKGTHVTRVAEALRAHQHEHQILAACTCSRATWCDGNRDGRSIIEVRVGRRAWRCGGVEDEPCALGDFAEIFTRTAQRCARAGTALDLLERP